ncbi:MAG: thioredoxin family protein [Bacteroidetes bacterium]|nr:thioredoxin family protein [Bacteroidota bacterium]
MKNIQIIKKSTIILLIIFFSSAFQSKEKNKSKGIMFFKGTLKEAKAKAKKENKLIFIDCYATWCGPCKNMTKKVFIKKEVGEFYNQNFVCIKLDMETAEGETIGNKYSVEAYPTYLFIDNNGALKHKDLGYLDPDAFIALGKNALTKK